MTDESSKSAPELALMASRQRVEESLEALRSAVRKTTGVQLSRRAWALPLVVAAVGFSVALFFRRRRRD
jgi:hypothetical protein